MARDRLTFRQADVERLVRAARAAGLQVFGVTVDANGKIEIVTCEKAARSAEVNEWDSARS
jgi:hypothetical protein